MNADQLMKDYENIRQSLLHAEQARQQDLDDMLTDEEKTLMDFHNTRIQSISEELKAAERRLKDAVLEHGNTVRGEHFQAVWSKPRKSYDVDGLVSWLLERHPDVVDKFKKYSAPMVSIKEIKARRG